VVNFETGFDPYHNSDGLWLPAIAIMFKNVSNEDISEIVEVKAIFINNTTAEQISEASTLLSASSKPFLTGTKKQITLQSSVGWTAVQDQNVSVKIMIENRKYKSFKISNQEFNGRINTVQAKVPNPGVKEDTRNEGIKSGSNKYDPIDPRARPGSGSYYQYTSKQWMDMSKGFDYGAEHPINETTEISETESRIIVNFSNGKSLIYEIVKVEPYEAGINYIVEINGRKKTITKGPAVEGGIRFSLEKEWMLNKIVEALPAGAVNIV
jgi:hypothetical protein